jgi:hypothetical protein
MRGARLTEERLSREWSPSRPRCPLEREIRQAACGGSPRTSSRTAVADTMPSMEERMQRAAVAGSDIRRRGLCLVGKRQMFENLASLLGSGQLLTVSLGLSQSPAWCREAGQTFDHGRGQFFGGSSGGGVRPRHWLRVQHAGIECCLSESTERSKMMKLRRMCMV